MPGSLHIGPKKVIGGTIKRSVGQLLTLQFFGHVLLYVLLSLQTKSEEKGNSTTKID